MELHHRGLTHNPMAALALFLNYEMWQYWGKNDDLPFEIANCIREEDREQAAENIIKITSSIEKLIENDPVVKKKFLEYMLPFYGHAFYLLALLGKPADAARMAVFAHGACPRILVRLLGRTRPELLPEVLQNLHYDIRHRKEFHDIEHKLIRTAGSREKALQMAQYLTTNDTNTKSLQIYVNAYYPSLNPPTNPPSAPPERPAPCIIS